MTARLEEALALVRSWPEARQDEVAELLLALDRFGADRYVATEEELVAIDEALEQVARGGRADDAAVESAFARFGR
jgi:hypothetical protein